MTQDLDFDELKIKALTAWLKRTVSTMGRALGDQLGRKLDIDIQTIGLKQDEEFRAMIPADGLSWGLTLSGSESQFLLLCGREIALALGQAKEDEEDAILKRLEEDGFLSEDEKSVAKQSQECLSAALIDAVKKDTNTDSLSPTNDFIDSSTWVSGSDPFGKEPLLVAEMTAKLGDKISSKGLIAITPTLICENFPNALVVTDDQESVDNLIFYPASCQMKEAIIAQIGAPTQDCETIAELMRGFVDDAVGGAVIGVNKGEEYILSLLRGMRELPVGKDKPIIVVLEQASTANVVRCGRLGLFHVLPQEFSAEDFQKTLSRPE